jgi:transcriptional antiterminator
MKVKTTFKYGIVIIESYDKTLGYTVYEYRKPTIKERQEIILNYIIEYNNEPIDLLYLSNKLCVSKRTIQKDITGKELTLELLYDLDNPYGFIDFDWKEFKMNPSLDKLMCA